MTKIGEMIRDEGINIGRIEIAKNLLRKGLTVELISETTSLDEETVLKLKEELVAA